MQAREVAEKMLGQTLVTKQTGPAGKPVNVLYVASKLSLEREMYFALLLDRQTAGAIILPGTADVACQNLGNLTAAPQEVHRIAFRSSHVSFQRQHWIAVFCSTGLLGRVSRTFRQKHVQDGVCNGPHGPRKA